MSDSSPLVEVAGVTKSYQKGKETVEVLHGLDLTIPRGDFVALMGPSGSGKTTLLNLLGGLDRPSGGSITIDGRAIHAMSGGGLAKWRSAHVGFVFQFYNLLPVLTAARNVELPLLLTNLSGAQRKEHVATALAVVGLSERGQVTIQLSCPAVRSRRGCNSARHRFGPNPFIVR